MSNDVLLGKVGSHKVEVNAAGRTVRQLDISPAEHGMSLKTTIDADLQTFAYTLLKPHKAAACVILEIPSGAVRCLVSVPSYSPTDLHQGRSQFWQELLQHPDHPLLHRAIAGQYPPASPFKIVTAMAALEAEIISPTETTFCPGYFDLGNHRFHCWRKTGHGAMNLAEAIQQSCDVYFFSLAGRLGVDRIAAMARRLGFGELTGISLYGEKKGLVPSRAWKLSWRQEQWSSSDTVLVAVGQGPVLVTPVQLATFIACIANNGARVRPTLIEDAPPPVKEDVELSPETIAFMQRTLIDVCMRGTGRRARTDDPTILVAGKTGTAQVQRISIQDRALGKTDTRLRPWHERDHALFVGYAPANAPRYALALIVEHGGKGGEVAAPIAKALFEKLLGRGATGSTTDATKEKTHAPAP
jgi:penicillin-binding protein 2